MGTCNGCVYFKACGQENRTAPCKGYQSRDERKKAEKAQENAKIQNPMFFDKVRSLAKCDMQERYDRIVKHGIRENDPAKHAS